MKVALHFDADDKSLGSFYGYSIYEEVFKKILGYRNLSISSKIFVGDLLFLMYSQEIVEEREKGNIKSTTYRVNQEKYIQLIDNWMFSEENNWKKFVTDQLDKVFKHNIFVVCFESIDLKNSEYLFDSLKDYKPFIGVMEINDSNKIHWELYAQFLIPFARIVNTKLSLFHNSIYDDDLDIGLQEEFTTLGFSIVDFEDLKARYNNNYNHARRIAEWKKRFGASLAFIADNVVSQLSDIAPDLGNKLWSASNTYESAETNEQFAQVITYL